MRGVKRRAGAHNPSQAGALPVPATTLFRLAGSWRCPDKALELGSTPRNRTKHRADVSNRERRALQALPSGFESPSVHQAPVV